MQNTQAIFESLFSGNHSDSQHTDFLKAITDRHPFFSPAHFFLLQNIKDDTDAFKKQALKTNIFFNNPHWLNFQLQQIHQQSLSPQSDITLSPNTAEPLLEDITDLPDDTEATETMEEEIEPMKIELKMPVEKSTMDEGLLFEPMHMVDYFASQGIKLSEDVQTGDKLGKQLKSFTDWLKTMKKVHTETDVDITEKTDINIQTLAETSNTDTGVLTESMAEVFAKQGKLAKASEVYQKLSLLNPAKSTYFAAKLENLKGN